MDKFGDEFEAYFQVVPASTQERVTECQRLRYQVFCREHRIFTERATASDLETDEFDRRSVHSLLRHRTTGLPVATVRLVLGRHSGPADKFPMEAHLGSHIYTRLTDHHRTSRTHLAEISRFAVSREFRRRAGEAERTNTLKQDLDVGVSGRGVRHHPYITLGLFKTIVQMSAENDVRYWCAAMEPTLIRLLTRFGIHFNPIGSPVEYYGLRQPCSAAVADVLAGIHAKRPDIWHFITDNGAWAPRA